MVYWKIKFRDDAQKQFNKLDKDSQKQIEEYLDNKILKLSNPTLLGKALLGNFRGYWRYRIGYMRVICEIRDKQLTILVVKIGKRDKVYE